MELQLCFGLGIHMLLLRRTSPEVIVFAAAFLQVLFATAVKQGSGIMLLLLVFLFRAEPARNMKCWKYLWVSRNKAQTDTRVRNHSTEGRVPSVVLLNLLDTERGRPVVRT